MKTITCDRCGEKIPYVPPYMNAAIGGKIPPNIMITYFDNITNQVREIDLCDKCKHDVEEFILGYRAGVERKTAVRLDDE